MIFNIEVGMKHTAPVLDSVYPADITVTCGTDAVFTVFVTDEGFPKDYTLQWYVDGVAVEGATEPTYTRSTDGDVGQHSVYCEVTNKAGTTTSRIATYTVNKVPVLNSSYPANASVTLGSSTTLKVAISTAGYPTSYTYQWYKGGTAISGATSSTYTFKPTAVGSATFYCKVTNTAGTVTSRTSTITVNALYLYNKGTFGSVNGTTLDAACVYDGTYYGKITKNSTNMEWYSSVDTKSMFYISTKIDCTAYSTLKFVVSSSDLTLEDYAMKWGLVSSANASGSNYVAVTTTDEFSGSNTISVNISSISGSYYIAMWMFSDSGSSVNISQILLT